MYFYFCSNEVDVVIDGLKKSGVDLKPKFKKYRYAEVIAVNKDLILGKYENIPFIISREEIDVPLDFLKKITVEVTPADKTFNESKFGKFKVEEGKIKLDTESSEELFYDLIPALQIEGLKSETLLREGNLQAEMISDEEGRIMRELSDLCDRARGSGISGLEEILSEVSEVHVDFFRRLTHFKDVIQRASSSVTRLEAISRMANLFSDQVSDLRESLETLKYLESKFEQTLIGIRDLFTLVSLRLDTLRNREYLDLQKRTASLQAAAAVIEFVAVYYYTLKIWAYFMPVEKIPALISFTLLFVFTSSVVIFTEVFGELIREKRPSKRFVFTISLLVAVIVLMCYMPALFSKV